MGEQLMAEFKTFLDVRIHNKHSKSRELLHDFIYVSDILGLIRVPKGFKTDFASIPWIFRPAFPTNYLSHAATVHDYLYRDIRPGQKIADEVFLEACLASGRSKALSHIAYRALRLAGWIAYKNNGD